MCKIGIMLPYVVKKNPLVFEVFNTTVVEMTKYLDSLF